jgi:hypothetical protein
MMMRLQKMRATTASRLAETIPAMRWRQKTHPQPDTGEPATYLETEETTKIRKKSKEK